MTRPAKEHPAAWSISNLLGISGRRVATIGLVLLSASMAVNFGELVVRGAEVQQKIERQREINTSHVAEKQRLEALLAYYESPVHAELVAREQLGYARDGDTVILPSIALAATTPAPTPPQPVAAPTPVPNWQRWWHAFFPAEGS